MTYFLAKKVVNLIIECSLYLLELRITRLEGTSNTVEFPVSTTLTYEKMWDSLSLPYSISICLSKDQHTSYEEKNNVIIIIIFN